MVRISDFEVGDLVKLTEYVDYEFPRFEGQIAEIIEVNETEQELRCRWPNDYTSLLSASDKVLNRVYKVNGKGDKMSECNNKEVSPQELRDLKLSPDDLLLVEAGVICQDGSLTSQGRDMVFDHMFDQVKDSLVMDIKKVKKARGDK